MAPSRGPLIAAGLAGASAFAALRLRASARGAPRPADQADGQRPRVVVLGAGFAGLAVCAQLRQVAGRAVDILLIDRHNYHLFTPMLYEVATCGVDPHSICFPVRQFASPRGIDFRQAMVTGVDFEAQRVHLSDGEEPYDFLVVALGSTTNFFGNQHALEHAYALKWVEEGLTIRNHVVDMFERAAKEADPAVRQRLLTFVVVGGGATGVETAGALADLTCQVLGRDYPALRPSDARIVVVEGEKKLLGHMGEDMAAAALEALQARGVEVRLGLHATDVEKDHVVTSDGQRLESSTILWTAGVRAPRVVSELDVPHSKGGTLIVDAFLRVQGFSRVYAAGDGALLRDHRTGQPVPMLAAAATREGKLVADNIARDLAGYPLKAFTFDPPGSVVSLGRGTGVSKLGPMLLQGLPGWLAWRAVHLALLETNRNRFNTALDWSFTFLYDRDTVRLDVAPTDSDAYVGEDEVVPVENRA